jgi:hypothetical protein
MIQIAAHLQSGGLLLQSDSKTAERLVLGDKKNTKVTDMIAALAMAVDGKQPMVEQILVGWQRDLESQSSSGLESAKLLSMGRIVGY